MSGWKLESLACAPGWLSLPLLSETRSVKPFDRSRTKTSGRPFVSLGTRLLARDPNATHLPVYDTDGSALSLSP